MKIRWIVAGIVVLVLQLKLFFGDSGWLQWWQKESLISETVEQNAALLTQRAVLQQRLHDIENNPQLIESIVRRELGMVKTNEVWYQYILSDTNTLGVQPLK